MKSFNICLLLTALLSHDLISSLAFATPPTGPNSKREKVPSDDRDSDESGSPKKTRTGHPSDATDPMDLGDQMDLQMDLEDDEFAPLRQIHSASSRIQSSTSSSSSSPSSYFYPYSPEVNQTKTDSASFPGQNSIESPSIPYHEFLKFFGMDSLVRLRTVSKAMQEKIDQNSEFNSIWEFYRFFETQLEEVMPTQLENGAYDALKTLFNSETLFRAGAGRNALYKPVSKLENLESLILNYRDNLEKELQTSTKNENKNGNENENHKKKIKPTIQKVTIALNRVRLLKTQLVNHLLAFKKTDLFSAAADLDQGQRAFINNEGMIALASESAEAQIQLLTESKTHDFNWVNLRSFPVITKSKVVAERLLNLILQDTTHTDIRSYVLSELLRQFQSDKEYQAILWDRFVNNSGTEGNAGLDQKHICGAYHFLTVTNILSFLREVTTTGTSNNLSDLNQINPDMVLFKNKLVAELISAIEENHFRYPDRFLNGLSDAQFDDSELRKLAILSAVRRLNQAAYRSSEILLKLIKNSNEDSITPEWWINTIESVNNSLYRQKAEMSVYALLEKALSSRKDDLPENIVKKIEEYRTTTKKEILARFAQSARSIGNILPEAIPYFSEDFEMLKIFFDAASELHEDDRTEMFVKLIQNESKNSTWVDLVLDYLAENMDLYGSSLNLEIILSTAATKPFLSLETRARILSLLPAMGRNHELSAENASAKAKKSLEEARQSSDSTDQAFQRLSSRADKAGISAKIAHVVAEARRVKIRTLLNITLEAEGFSGSLQ